MMRELYEVTLPNGTKAAVDKKTAVSIETLRDLQMELANGQVAAWAVTRVLTTEDKSAGMLVYFDPKKLPAMSDMLSDFSRKCGQQASLWEGDAPPANRSFGMN